MAGLLAAREQGIKKGQPTNRHLFSVCCIPIAGLLRFGYREPKARTKCKANTRHMPHALTCLDTALSPITWCLIAWEPKAWANTNYHVHQKPSTHGHGKPILPNCISTHSTCTQYVPHTPSRSESLIIMIHTQSKQWMNKRNRRHSWRSNDRVTFSRPDAPYLSHFHFNSSSTRAPPASRDLFSPYA